MSFVAVGHMNSNGIYCLQLLCMPNSMGIHSPSTWVYELGHLGCLTGTVSPVDEAGLTSYSLNSSTKVIHIGKNMVLYIVNGTCLNG